MEESSYLVIEVAKCYHALGLEGSYLCDARCDLVHGIWGVDRIGQVAGKGDGAVVLKKEFFLGLVCELDFGLESGGCID